MRAVFSDEGSRVARNENNASNTETTSVGGGGDHSRLRRRIRNPLSPPTTIELSGVKIHFPFRPYKCQETYMETVMNALLKSENALLESPTGTGKTLCLLCACLAWQRQQFQLMRNSNNGAITPPTTTSQLTAENNSIPQSQAQQPQQQQQRKVPTIIYASRTHSQLSQVVRELRNTRYRPNHAVLGSREQMCINPKVNPNHQNHNANTTNPSSSSSSNASDINHKCNKLGQDRKCRYRNNLEGFSPPNNDAPCGGGGGQQQHHQAVLDMEELVTMGKTHTVCPFYYTRSKVEGAELILLPYNYLFDKDSRDLTLKTIHWSNAIVIFDEAHNLESFASESSSFDLSNADIAGCISEVTKAINYIQAMSGAETAANLKLENLVKIKAIFLQLEDYILNSLSRQQQTSYNGEFIMEIFRAACGITHANHEILIEEIRKINDLIMDLRSGGGSSSASRGSPKLEHFVQCLKRVFGHALESRCLAKAAFYRVHVSSPSTSSSTSNVHPSAGKGNNGYSSTTPGNQGRTISYWCFAPALAMEELANLNVRSILVTSGTLSPLPSYSMELGLPFPHQLENPHIISSKQIHVRVIGKGVSGKLLNSSYERRSDQDYTTELGNTLVSIAKVTPAGVLVFFPSYSVMEHAIEAWGGPVSSRNNNSSSSGYGSKNNDFFAKKRKVPAGKTPFSFPFAPVHFATDKSARVTIWKRMLSTKAVVVEPKTASDLTEALSEFKKFLDLPKSSGCILMGVCRGKISEGIDFANEQSRAVVITGLPFPPSFDAKVKMKREFLDTARANRNMKASSDGGFAPPSSAVGTSSSSGLSSISALATNRLSGHEWYTQQAHRAVNQAIGRVIRNQNDYGAVLLLDSRFDQVQNQAGLSKWLRPHLRKDEGFGNAIRGLVDFFKTAESFTKTKEQEERMATARAGPILEYDDDDGYLGGQEEVPTSKVAVIRQSTTDDGVGTDSAAYVAPGDVIARIDVNDLQRPKSPPPPTVSATKLTSKPPPRPSDALFGRLPGQRDSGPMTGRSNTPKELAVRFMEMTKENLSSADQSTIRKAIVALKGAGDKGDTQAYLKSSSTIVRLINRCEVFESPQQAQPASPRMLFLFFGLLPKPFRKRVEIMSFKLVFETSSLGGLVKKHIESEFDDLSKAMGPLLQTLWCRISDVPMPTEVYLRQAQYTMEKLRLMESTLLGTTMLKAYLKLIPDEFRIATRTWVMEKTAMRNMHRIKEEDKRKAEDTISVAVSSSTVVAVQNATVISKKEPPKHAPPTNGTVILPKPSILKRKLHEPFAVPESKPTASNPYSKKKILVATGDKKASSSKQQQQQPTESTVSAYLKSAESEVYTGGSKPPNAAQIMKCLKTNATHEITCPICSGACPEPFVAECGHMACLSCWLDWLNRSQSCMTCRMATTKASLARVVYESKPGSGAPPTLSQLCGTTNNNDDDDSDDELEIC